jgi:hypothetical protein
VTFPEMGCELSCGSIFRMNFIASSSGLVSSSLNFTSTSWYASMNWSSSVSISTARPSSVVCCRASISLALMASTLPPTMGAPSHASRRPPPLASYSTGLPLAPLFPVAATVFSVSNKPTPGGCSGRYATTALGEDAHGRW